MFTGEEWLVLVPISLDWGTLVPGFFFRDRKRGHDTAASGIPIHRVKWRHRVYGHDTIAILWV